MPVVLAISVFTLMSLYTVTMVTYCHTLFQCETSPASDVPAISLPAGHCITICLCTLNPDISYLEYAGFCDIPKVFLPNFEAVIEANELGIIVTPCSCSMLTVSGSYNDIVLSTDHVGLLIISCCMLEKMFG